MFLFGELNIILIMEPDIIRKKNYRPKVFMNITAKLLVKIQQIESNKA